MIVLLAKVIRRTVHYNGMQKQDIAQMVLKQRRRKNSNCNMIMNQGTPVSNQNIDKVDLAVERTFIQSIYSIDTRDRHRTCDGNTKLKGNVASNINNVDGSLIY